MNKVKLSKLLSYILRHKPEAYGIQLDDAGWVEVSELIEQIAAREPGFQGLEAAVFEDLARQGGKQRFEITGGRIRAFYGHSIEKRIERVRATPPAVLYHGTPNKTLSHILNDGLKAMSRQNVHMSSDKHTAELVAKRWHSEFTILQINAQQAHDEGVLFYRGNENIWLADHVPPQYIEVNS